MPPQTTLPLPSSTVIFGYSSVFADEIRTDSREIEMFYNPVRNFVYRANTAENPTADIISQAVKYYNPDILIKAKKVT
jgi:hypothetical protein